MYLKDLQEEDFEVAVKVKNKCIEKSWMVMKYIKRSVKFIFGIKYIIIKYDHFLD